MSGKLIATVLLLTINLSAAAMAEEIIVSAAASLTPVMKKVEAAFEGTGIKPIFNFASSGALYRQIQNGAPVDLYLSANKAFMDRAEAEGLVLKETRTVFASNRLVLIVPSPSSIEGNGYDLLTDDAVETIALGNPATVPAGKYARTALTAGGIWEDLTAKYIFGNSVRQVLQYTITGEVDAGIVYNTDAVSAAKKVKTLFRLEATGPIIYPAAVVTASQKREAAEQFIQWLISEDGMALLRSFGFGQPEKQLGITN